jgi:hypothetical protein
MFSNTSFDAWKGKKKRKKVCDIFEELPSHYVKQATDFYPPEICWHINELLGSK